MKCQIGQVVRSEYYCTRRILSFETVTILFFIYLQMTIIQVGYYYYIQYYDRVQIQYLRTT
ncbi:hypothetical protein DW695_07760 [Bacteroides fragilis]|nr:hypothetical protein DW695_07760 [Bacteroides fragilis]